MANTTVQTMGYANNATITTVLERCAQVINVTQTVQDLYNFYQNNNFSMFYNISITNFSCTSSSGKYFEQIITFTKSVSLRIQIALVSTYFDYINANGYNLNGFLIDQEARFNLSSITLNYSSRSDACSSSEAAHDPLCLLNSSTPTCTEPYPNPWIVNCSVLPSTSINTSLFTTTSYGLSTTNSFILNSWQIGLISGLSVFLLLILFLFVGCIWRRHSRSKRIALSSENLFDDMKSMKKSGIPYGQAFQRTATLVQPKRTSKTPIAWINDGIGTNKNYINLKPPGPHNQGTFINHAKVYDPAFPSNILPKSIKPIYIQNNHPAKVNTGLVISRPVSGTSTNQLKSIIDGLEESKLDDSDSISLDRSTSTNRRKSSTPVSRQFANASFVDESLHDEDAWMSILAVANAELDVLNRLENEQNRIKTAM